MSKLMFKITFYNLLNVLNFIICLFPLHEIDLIAYWYFSCFQQRNDRQIIIIIKKIDLPTIIWAETRENLSLGFPTRFDTNWAVEPKKTARCLIMSHLGRRWIVLSVAKTTALISCAVAALLIFIFVFVCTKIRFSHDEAHVRGKRQFLYLKTTTPV